MCRELYNTGLQERMLSYKATGKGVTWLQQQSQLPAIKEVRPEFKGDHAHTLQAVLIRLDRWLRLSDRVHVCTACGWIADRDHLSAQVIFNEHGLGLQTPT